MSLSQTKKGHSLRERQEALPFLAVFSVAAIRDKPHLTKKPSLCGRGFHILFLAFSTLFNVAASSA